VDFPATPVIRLNKPAPKFKKCVLLSPLTQNMPSNK